MNKFGQRSNMLGRRIGHDTVAEIEHERARGKRGQYPLRLSQHLIAAAHQILRVEIALHGAVGLQRIGGPTEGNRGIERKGGDIRLRRKQGIGDAGTARKSDNRHIGIFLADPARDPVIVGAFTFRRKADFAAAARRLVQRDGRVGGELYVDSALEDALASGLDCRLFEVERYLCWGTPHDLRTYEYWQSFFHKWPAHPYRLEDDPRLDAAAAVSLAERYAARFPAGSDGAGGSCVSDGSDVSDVSDGACLADRSGRSVE